MRIKVLCISEEPGHYQGKKGQVDFQEVALLDQDPAPESRMKATFDYRLSLEEKDKFAGKLLGKSITLDVKDIALFNNRIQIKSGRLVEVLGVNGK